MTAAPDARQIITALKGKWAHGKGMALCPAHDEKTPSLSVSETLDGRVLVHCFAGCTQMEVIGALRSRGLWPEKQESSRETAEALRARRKAEKERRDREAKKAAKRRQDAADAAQSIIQRATIDVHPYLAAKGFPDHKAYVLGDELLIPMRPIDAYHEVASLQRIWPDGNKKFLAGGRAKGCVFRFGRSGEQWWCEGFATALSVLAALRALYRQGCVTVCFSASNIAHVAKRGFIVADHDKHRVGEKAAKATGLPYWLPPDQGDDANDFHLQYGVDALARELRTLIARPLR